jgi:pimeloyl-ACP methyl ester carboxylesterase
VALLEKDFAHFEKVIIPGVPHMVNLENPEAFNLAVLNFLDKIDK